MGTGLLALIPVLVTVALWRFTPAPWVLAVSGLAIVLAWLAGLGQRHTGRTALWALVAALVASLIAVPVLWPCEIACSGADHYRSLFGVATWAWAAMAYVVLAALAGLAVRVHRLHDLAILLGWACVGTSLWFLWLSWRLDLLCGHCLAVHSVVLALAGQLPRRPGPGPLAVLGSAMLAALAAHAAWHPGPATPARAVPQAQPVLTTTDWDGDAVAAAKVIGDPTSPWHATLVLDPVCPHCRQGWSDAVDQLGPAITDRRLRLTIRLRFNPRRESAAHLARLVCASALRETMPRDNYRLIGIDATLPWETVHTRLAADGALRLPALERIVAAAKPSIDAALATDQRWLEATGHAMSTTPILVLDGPDGVSGTWTGTFDASEAAALIPAP